MFFTTPQKPPRLYLLCSLQHPETGPKLSLKVKGGLHPKESTRGLTPPNGLGLVCCSTSAILASEFFAQHRNSDSKQVRISFHHTSAPAVQSRRGPLPTNRQRLAAAGKPNAPRVLPGAEFNDIGPKPPPASLAYRRPVHSSVPLSIS